MTRSELVIGWSGHDDGTAMGLVAYLLGARIIEKHFMLDRTLKGTDHVFSLEPDGLRAMVCELEQARESLGDGVKKKRPREVAPMAKSLFAARALPAGHVVTADDLAIKCPGDSVPVYELENVLGRPLLADLAEDDALRLEQLGPALAPVGRAPVGSGRSAH